MPAVFLAQPRWAPPQSCPRASRPLSWMRRCRSRTLSMIATASGPWRNSRKARAASLSAPFLSSTASCLIGIVQVLRHDPARPFVAAGHLSQRDEAELGIAGLHELEGLADVVALHDLGLELIVDAERLHRLHGGRAVGRRLGVGDGDLGEVTVLQGLLALHEVRVLAPEHERSDRVGELASRNGKSLLHRLPRPLVVGREEHLEGRFLRDLGVKLAGRAEAQDRLVAGLLLEAAAISWAASVKFAATATLVCAACAGSDAPSAIATPDKDMKDTPGQPAASGSLPRSCRRPWTRLRSRRTGIATDEWDSQLSRPSPASTEDVV